jgi:site-specific DNA-methyltransferase (adenine-specific)
MTANNQDFTLSAESPADLQPVMGVGSTALLGSVSLSCEDCMALMRRYPDKHFDLAIVDPPYRDENQPTKDMRANGSMKTLEGRPPPEYWSELLRVSREQIVWGANNFQLPQWKGFVVWKKQTITEDFTMSMCEVAALSEGLSTVSKWVELRPQDPQRIHPTQKPVALYAWLFERYAKPGWKVLDTHLGSGSHAIACHYAGMHLTACEIDADYFAAAQQRIARETRQTTLF